ncbi:hypothetical protein GLOTRDRAFT_103928 [Gloeophyllum trabeum ATCC 11539]|uniref:CCHC-type domain-containing protein n=1 Tax=Gloeophyllum trabeum (strain ATCC 11539 / FP-39264 / Madison 617) TaxID=670483 RepID=S7QDP6_GLOTA|nr:uncharacterized protein GLOTRDRAFT_103928 [Gloeophyllum trabeum ATCC 11539]EPQ57961.1 hypothetical protein GLOTRDRAFT_103928 [Gloeophyllum trabeum ATCC 11539]
MQRPFDLDIINIQDKGQEKWKKKYVYWIPALHLEGKEIAKGRWDAQTDDGRSRCFNCGSKEHMVSSCPLPLDRQLISLSRQLRNFYHELRDGPGQGRRFHVVEDWKNQRLRWLDEFEPGQVRGALLREALQLEDGDPGENAPWLKNIAVWGYPPGWTGERDPKEKVAMRIVDLDEEGGSDDADDESFFIFGERGDEEVNIKLPMVTAEPSSLDDDGSNINKTTEAVSAWGDVTTERNDAIEQTKRGVLAVSGSRRVRRWAQYPSTYFSSELLPVYVGVALPPLSPAGDVPASADGDGTYTLDRETLWANILAGHRVGSAAHAVHLITTPGLPPAPPGSPPPPPPPPELPPPPPPPPISGTLNLRASSGSAQADEDDKDMDLSD